MSESEPTTEPTCDRPIIGRDGKPLGFNCNLPAGHLGLGGKCASIWQEPGKPTVAVLSEKPETTVSRGG